jgi:hypothetical protein
MIPASANGSSVKTPSGLGTSAADPALEPGAGPVTEAAVGAASDPAPVIEVRHEPALARYTIWRDGEHVGLTDYAISGHEVKFTHTEVNPAYRQEGLASILVEFALDDVRERTDLRVVAQCPYVRKWIHQHAEYQDLLTRGH